MKKKLLIFHQHDTCVGAGLCLIQIVQALKKNYDITVCLPKNGGNLNNLLIKEKIKTIYISGTPVQYSHYNGGYHNFFSLYHIKNIIRIIKNKKIINQIIEEISPDMILCNSLTLFWIGKIAKKYNIKTCIYIRETYCNTKFNFRTNYLKKSINNYFDKIIAISNYDLNQTSNKKNKNYYKITDKVDFTLYDDLKKNKCREELNISQDDKIILYVGGDSKIKGPLVILNAMKYVGNAKLLYLQHYTSKKSFKNFIKRLLKLDDSYIVEKFIKKNNLEEKIILKSSTNKVEKYFIASDIVVFPMIIAHQARPVYEAGYARKPIIISDFNNIKEFANEKNVFLFKPGNYNQLANTINYIFKNNDNDIIQKIQNNYNNTVNNHNFKTFNKELINCFND